MCDYCRVDEFGDYTSKPFIKVWSKIFGAKATVEARIYGNRISCYIGTQNDILIDEYKEIKFCPMCGRKLNDANRAD